MVKKIHILGTAENIIWGFDLLMIGDEVVIDDNIYTCVKRVFMPERNQITMWVKRG